MFKSRSVIISCILPILAILCVLGFAVYRDSKSRQVFAESGYFLLTPDSSFSDEVNKQIYFEKGSKYKIKYPNKLVFKDIKNDKVVLDANLFAHYNDGSIGILSNGVMIDFNEIDNPIINHYGLTQTSLLQNAGTGFVIDNRGDSLYFKDFIIKISDTKYLLCSEKITITFSNNNVKEFEDYVELNYYDTGIIRIVTQEGTWQTVALNSTARLANNVVINLANRTVLNEDGQVRLSLEQMVIDSDDNIRIIPDEVKNKMARVPEFDITTIDGADGQAGNRGEDGLDGEAGERGIDGERGIKGEDGEDGDDGEKGSDGKKGKDGIEGANGEAGEPGELGEPGEPGISGQNGQPGAPGPAGPGGAAGANGAKGADGKSGDELIEDGETGGGIEPIKNVQLPKFEIADFQVGSNSVKATITVTDDESRLDSLKPFEIQIIENLSGIQVYRDYVDSSNRVFDVECNLLLPNKDYRLVIIADYYVDNAAYSRIFVNKLFVTDGIGLTIEKYSATESSLAVKVKKKSDSNIVAADLQLIDSTGTPISTQLINIAKAETIEGDIIEFAGLEANKPYKVKLVNIQVNYDTNLLTPPQIEELELWTLKRMPVLGLPVVIINKRSTSFDLKLESVEDIDNAIIRYRYEIYEVDYAQNNRLVKQFYSTSNDLMPCYVDGIEIKGGYNYRARIVAECFDNEKMVTVASAFSDVFSMEGSRYPTVIFEKDDEESKHDKLVGNIRLLTNGSVITVNGNEPLIIQYQSTTGKVNSYSVTELPTALKDEKGTDYYVLPFNKNGLKADDNYIISVYGTVDLNDGAGPRKNSLLGNTIVKTSKPAELKANFYQDSNPTSAISFRINLTDMGETGSASYEASTIYYLELNIYNGDESAVQNSRPVASRVFYDENYEGGTYIPYKSTIADKVYGEGNTMLITEETLGINPANVASKYTVEIKLVHDYTEFRNEFVVHNNVKTFTKQAALPNLDLIDVNDGLVVTPITRVNINKYVKDTKKLEEYEKYDPDIIFGYEVRAAYFDNSTDLVESFIYYVFEEADYDPGDNATNFYANATPLCYVEKQMTEADFGFVPSAVFLFDEATNMSRGSKFVFTYRAKLKQVSSYGSAIYFPEFIRPEVIIRSRTALAPYQTPKFYFYPWKSDNSSVTWKYYIDAPDTQAVGGNFRFNKNGTYSGELTKALNGSAQLTVSGLVRGDRYTVGISARNYKPIYNDSSYGVELLNYYFEGVYDTSYFIDNGTLSYKIEDVRSQNRVRITVSDSDEQARHLSRVVALNVTATPRNQSKDPIKDPISVIVPLESVAGQTAVGYLKYSSIEKLKGNTLDITVNAIYDSGKIGFEYDDKKEKALQVMTPEGNGNYITLDYTHSGVIEDTSGKAKGSYFRIDTISKGRSNISVQYTSLINTNHTGVLNFTKGRNGSRLENLNHRPVVTLKDTVEVGLNVEGGASINFTEITPMVNLNDGPAYTIDTTVTTANVRWQLFGHEEKLRPGYIKDNKMILELFKVNKLGLEETTGTKKEVDIDINNNNYETLFEDLESNTKYGVKLYFIDTSSGEEKRVYPINLYIPDREPSANLYTFTTSDQIEIGQTSVKYVANSYNDKYIQLTYSLNQTLGFNIEYSFGRMENGNFVQILSSSELSANNIIKTPSIYTESMNERIMLRPGQLKWKENGVDVYFPFDSNDYYICIKPVSKTNPNDLLGEAKYVKLNIPSLSVPFYNVRSTPSTDKVSFSISVLDPDKVIVNGRYRIKILNDIGKDITPVVYQDMTFSISATSPAIEVDVSEGDRAILQIYTVYDTKNTGRDANGNSLHEIGYSDLNNEYLKFSTVGYPLGDKGYNIGDVQIAMIDGQTAGVYFTNSVNLNKIVRVSYVVINEQGASVTYNEPFVPKAAGDRMLYELSHKFASNGIYQIQIRFYDDVMNIADERVLTLFKNF